MYTIYESRKEIILDSLKDYHGDNAEIIYNIFEQMYNSNKLHDYTILDVLEHMAKINKDFQSLPSWFIDVLPLDYDSFYEYILQLKLIENGKHFIMFGYDEYYYIGDIVRLIKDSEF